MRRRVVVTGMGSVSPVGSGVDKLWSAARDGFSGVREVILSRPCNNHVKIAAQALDFDPTAHVSPELAAQTDRVTQFVLSATAQAIGQAGLAESGRLGERTAVIVGTGYGGATTIDDQHHGYYILNSRPNPMTIPRVMCSASASHVSMRYGVTGPTFAVSSACSSATQAIGLGLWMVRAGMVDRALVGGTEALITPSTFRAWEALRVLTPNACRPFSKQRNGMVLGEGAAMFVLEPEDMARARGAAAYATIAGYGTSSDANDLLRPDAEGEAAAMRSALEDAELPAEEIDYVNAHGTGTVMNDATETRALRQVFGALLDRMAVSSTKPIHGHAIGATGALELAITIMALRESVAPPTINWVEADPACDIDAVPNVARATPIRAALSNSFAFGGINAVLAVTHADA